MSVWEVILRIVVAAVLAGLIGIERELHEHAAGFRTHILVGVGAAAFTLASSYGFTGSNFDPNRISAQVVTGIGFLGAGAIIRYGVNVKGLTTAASLWTVAAVGLLAAQGFWVASLVTTGVVILSLVGLRSIEKRVLSRLIRRNVPVRVHFNTPGYAPLAELANTLKQAHVVIKEMTVLPEEDTQNVIHLLLDLPRTVDENTALAMIVDIQEVQTARLE